MCGSAEIGVAVEGGIAVTAGNVACVEIVCGLYRIRVLVGVSCGAWDDMFGTGNPGGTNLPCKRWWTSARAESIGEGGINESGRRCRIAFEDRAGWDRICRSPELSFKYVNQYQCGWENQLFWGECQ